MLTLLTMSFKNIFRYKTRSIITILAIIVSVCISIVIDGLLRGIGDQSTVNLIAYESAEATLFRQGYLEKQAEFRVNHFFWGANGSGLTFDAG